MLINKEGITPYVASWITMINIRLMGSHAHQYLDMVVTFSILSINEYNFNRSSHNKPHVMKHNFIHVVTIANKTFIC